MRRKFYLLVAALLSIFLFVSCGGSKEETAKKGGVKDTLVVANGADAKSLDPHATNDAPSSRVTVQIYDRLVEQDDNMNIVPSLAESWEQPDGMTTIFHLKKGIKFHNGDELKASDVKFSLDRMKASPQVSHIIGTVDKIEVIDDYTVKIITSEPFGALLNHLTHPTAAIMSEKAVKAAGDSYGQHPVGTGPYKFVSWQSGDKITLEANPDYFLGVTPIKNVVFRPVTEASNRTIGIETGELDLAYDIEGLDREKLRNDDSIVFLEEPSFGIDYIGFNTRKAPFDNVKVRQAIATAINADDFITAVYKGSGEKANSLIGPKVFGYTTEAKAWEYNVEKAKQLLAEAGYPNGFKAKIWINENVERRDIAIILQAQLKEIGIDMKIETLEWGTYLQKTAQGEHQALLGGWVSGTSDADIVFFPLLHSSSHGGAGNRAFYTNKELDKVIEEARLTSDSAERKALFFKGQEILQEDAPFGLLLYKNENIGLNKRVKEFKYDATTMHNLKDLYIENK